MTRLVSKVHYILFSLHTFIDSVDGFGVKKGIPPYQPFSTYHFKPERIATHASVAAAKSRKPSDPSGVPYKQRYKFTFNRCYTKLVIQCL